MSSPMRSLPPPRPRAFCSGEVFFYSWPPRPQTFCSGGVFLLFLASEATCLLLRWSFYYYSWPPRPRAFCSGGVFLLYLASEATCLLLSWSFFIIHGLRGYMPSAEVEFFYILGLRGHVPSAQVEFFYYSWPPRPRAFCSGGVFLLFFASEATCLLLRWSFFIILCLRGH